MKPMSKYSDNRGGGNSGEADVTMFIDYLPLLSEFEVFGAITNANPSERSKQAQYAFFAAGNSKVKYNQLSTFSASAWWLRSVWATSNGVFCSATASGAASGGGANYTRGLAPIFKV